MGHSSTAMKRILVLLLIALPFLSAAQDPGRRYIDSLKSESVRVREDTIKSKILATICARYASYSPDSGILFGQQALALGRKYKQSVVLIYAYRSMGFNYRYKGDYELALAYYDSSLQASKEAKDTISIAKAYDYISVVKIDQSDYPAALDFAFKSLAILEKQKKSLSGNYINISIIYSDMGNYDKAVDYLQKALKIAETNKNEDEMEIALSNLGRNYLMMGKDSLALEIELRALKLAEGSEGKNGVLPIYSYIATAYYDLGDLTASSEYFSKGLEIAKELKNKKSIAENLANLGEIYLGLAIDSVRDDIKGKYKLPDKRTALRRAIDYTQQSADLHLELHNLRDLSYNYKMLSTAWDLAGNKGKALEMYKLYADYHDSVFSKDNKSRLATLEKQRELDSVKQQVKIDQLKIAQQNLAATNKRNERAFLFVGIGLLLVVIVFIALERRKSESLLLNILPPKIAERLKQKEHPIADHFVAASIIFIDMAGFTALVQNRDAKETVTILNDIFTRFDALAEKHGLEKIKTIGDCYMAVAGLPEPRKDHAKAAALMALNIKDLMHEYKTPEGTPIKFRIGLDCGPVVAGVIGKKKFIYDLWGNAVNTASRMESTGIAGEIQCTDNFREELIKEHAGKFKFRDRGMIEIKGKGVMQTWLIDSNS